MFGKSFFVLKNVSSILSKFVENWKKSDFQIQKRKNVTNSKEASETLDGRKTLDLKPSEGKSEYYAE